MQNIKNQAADIIRLSAGPAQSFFGYYDLLSWDPAGKRHLANQVDFADRLPGKDDQAQLGMVDAGSQAFTPIATTTAWNFQQGAFLQWNPGTPDEVIFNIRQEQSSQVDQSSRNRQDSWRGQANYLNPYRGLIRNIRSGSERIIDLPIACVAPDGRSAVSISFARMFDFRPGYGYAGQADPFADNPWPEEDGIFLIDLATGKSRLILSLRQIHAELQRQGSPVAAGKLLVNHINFNTDGSRFVFLARSFPVPGGHWGTAVMTANRDGSELYLLSDYLYASHYHWRDPENLLIHANHKQGKQLYLFRDRTQEARIIDAGYFLKDGHCSYSPDREWILYDSYPDQENYRSLYLYNVAAKKGITLASLYSSPVAVTDIRCDLHPRWHPSGKSITFDSTHEQHRHIYLMNLEEVMKTEVFPCKR